jgi:hypothetical protein
MTSDRFEGDPWDRARRGAHAVADVLAFLTESACVGNGVFWFITWGMLSFDWNVAAREYGRFWTHYAKANPVTRHPVEICLILIFVALTGLTAVVRAPRAASTWTPWPYAWPRPRAERQRTARRSRHERP